MRPADTAGRVPLYHRQQLDQVYAPMPPAAAREEYGGGLISTAGNWSSGTYQPRGDSGDKAAYDPGIASGHRLPPGYAVTLETLTSPCCISSTRTELTASSPPPTPSTITSPRVSERRRSWQRTMSILEGAYAGANSFPATGI
jgi:hypothetical protein